MHKIMCCLNQDKRGKKVKDDYNTFAVDSQNIMHKNLSSDLVNVYVHKNLVKFVFKIRSTNEILTKGTQLSNN